mmetsp:Transcript_22140/g.47588  ORF Transcript_22140/g.47588 Transcript_22140/m.47588 type:complete len:209 (-) Transcript_22140:811-1437(-)
MGALGDLARLVVPDVRVERRHQHQRSVKQTVDPFFIGLDAHHASRGEAGGGVTQQPRRVQEARHHDRLEHVQLELSLHPTDAYGRVIPHDLGAHHGQRLALGGIDLPGHDGAPRLVRGETQLAEAAPRTRPEEPHVVGDLVQPRGQRVERSGYLDQGIVGRQRLEQVRGGGERKARVVRYLLRDGGRVPLSGVQAGAHRGAAQSEAMQ